MITTTLCIGCGAVLTNGLRNCAPCTEALMADVRNAHDILRELDVTLARLDKVTPASVGGRSASTPLPYSVGASLAAAELRGSIRAMARGDVGREQVVRFRNARARAMEAIDIPDPRVFVGACECGNALYARTGECDVVCRRCGVEWDATPIDATAELRKMVGPIPALRSWLMHLGIVRSRAQLYRDVAALEPVYDEPRSYSLAEVYQHVLAKDGRRQRMGA